jgi:type IV secretory pathway VirB6-like protein
MDSLLGKFIKTGLDATMLSFSKKGLFMPYFVGVTIFLSTLISAAGLFVIIVLSKILLSVMLGAGPIFIVARMFNTWGKMFDQWIQQCANFALIPLFGYMTAIFTLSFSMLSIEMATITQNLGQATMMVFVAFINWVAMKKVYEVSASISSGFALGDEYRARRAAYDLAKKQLKKTKGVGRKMLGNKEGAAKIV